MKLFKDLAASRSVSRAAHLNGISQSAASQQLQEMERHLGVVLVDRSTRPLSLTEPGRTFLDFCREVLRRKEDLDSALGIARDGAERRVRVAAIYSVQLSEMTELEHEFSRLHPDCTLQVEYLRPERIYEAVLADGADLGLVSYPESTREITAIPWRREEMAVVASPFHPLVGKRAVHPADLAGYEFVAFDSDLPIQRDIDRFLAEHRVDVRRTFHFDNMNSVKGAVEQRAGISILPVRTVHAEIAEGRLVALPFEGAALFRPLGIVHRKKQRFGRAARAFLDLLQAAPAPVSVGIE